MCHIGSSPFSLLRDLRRGGASYYYPAFSCFLDKIFRPPPFVFRLSSFVFRLLVAAPPRRGLRGSVVSLRPLAAPCLRVSVVNVGNDRSRHHPHLRKTPDQPRPPRLRLIVRSIHPRSHHVQHRALLHLRHDHAADNALRLQLLERVVRIRQAAVRPELQREPPLIAPLQRPHRQRIPPPATPPAPVETTAAPHPTAPTPVNTPRSGTPPAHWAAAPGSTQRLPVILHPSSNRSPSNASSPSPHTPSPADHPGSTWQWPPANPPPPPPGPPAPSVKAHAGNTPHPPPIVRVLCDVSPAAPAAASLAPPVRVETPVQALPVAFRPRLTTRQPHRNHRRHHRPSYRRARTLEDKMPAPTASLNSLKSFHLHASINPINHLTN